MKKQIVLGIVLFAFVIANQEVTAQHDFTPADPEYYAMDREHINVEDYHTFLFNHRGFVSPRQFSLTQLFHV